MPETRPPSGRLLPAPVGFVLLIGLCLASVGAAWFVAGRAYAAIDPGPCSTDADVYNSTSVGSWSVLCVPAGFAWHATFVTTAGLLILGVFAVMDFIAVPPRWADSPEEVDDAE